MRLGLRIQKRVRREFFPDDYEGAVELLTRWSTTACAPGESPGRMHAAVLTLARGDVAALKRAIGTARGDFRDVLCPGYGPAVECSPGEGPVSADEVAFLTAIRRRPADNAIRLVYADWLQERGDGHRAKYLRILCQWLAAHPAADRGLMARERELRMGLGRGWLARVRGMRVREQLGQGELGATQGGSQT
jgi:uncharacterized protein (TIGR02996 family)